MRTIGARVPTEPNTPLSDARAVSEARSWLAAHHLFPDHAGPLTQSILHAGGIRSIRFVPMLKPPLLATAQIPAITVTLDSHGQVLNAHILWAAVERTGTVAVRSPSVVATANERAPAAGPGTPTSTRAQIARPTPALVVVTRVTLAYQPLAGNDGSTLRPVYLFTGTLGGRPFSRPVAADSTGP
jgi:hypothetical protein